MIKIITQHKKIILILIAAVILLAAGIYALKKYVFITKLDPLPRDEKALFSSIDYDYNIFNDIIYKNKNREIYYIEYGVGELLTAENLSSFRASAAFFYEYINAVINGEYNNYADNFTADFLKHYIIPEKFTMQKLYDISAELYKIEPTDDGVLCYYILRLKIMNNNGTYRDDVGSDTVAPILYVLKESGQSVKIAAIQKINQG